LEDDKKEKENGFSMFASLAGANKALWASKMDEYQLNTFKPSETIISVPVIFSYTASLSFYFLMLIVCTHICSSFLQTCI
jgi:hypothetical protein